MTQQDSQSSALPGAERRQRYATANMLWFALGCWLVFLLIGLYGTYVSPPPGSNLAPPSLIMLWPLFTLGYALAYSLPFGIWLRVRASRSPTQPARRFWIPMLFGVIAFIANWAVLIVASSNSGELSPRSPLLLFVFIAAIMAVHLLIALFFAEWCFCWQRRLGWHDALLHLNAKGETPSDEG